MLSLILAARSQCEQPWRGLGRMGSFDDGCGGGMVAVS